MALTPEQLQDLDLLLRSYVAERIRAGAAEFYADWQAATLTDAQLNRIVQHWKARRKAERMTDLRGHRRKALEVGMTQEEWAGIQPADP